MAAACAVCYPEILFRKISCKREIEQMHLLTVIGP